MWGLELSDLQQNVLTSGTCPTHSITGLGSGHYPLQQGICKTCACGGALLSLQKWAPMHCPNATPMAGSGWETVQRHHPQYQWQLEACRYCWGNLILIARPRCCVASSVTEGAWLRYSLDHLRGRSCNWAKSVVRLAKENIEPSPYLVTFRKPQEYLQRSVLQSASISPHYTTEVGRLTRSNWTTSTVRSLLTGEICRASHDGPNAGLAFPRRLGLLDDVPSSSPGHFLAWRPLCGPPGRTHICVSTYVLFFCFSTFMQY